MRKLQLAGPRIRTVLVMTLCCLTAGGAGFFFGRTGIAPPSQAVPGLDYFLTPATFSEISNAKAVLEAASSRLIMQMRIARGVGQSTSRSNTADPSLTAANAIAVLEEGVEEFRGTGAEFSLIRELLGLLKREEHYDRWLDLHTETLQQYPAQELVHHLADDAVMIASTVGRRHELSRSLHAIRRFEAVPEAAPHLKTTWAKLDPCLPSRSSRTPTLPRL